MCKECQSPFSVLTYRAMIAQFCSTRCHGIWRTTSELAGFWDKVQRCAHGDDCPFCCWPFGGATQNKYQNVSIRHKTLGAHRLAWELWNKQRMPPELDTAHWCHWKPCCNPWHVRPATPKENAADSVRDKRYHFGENHHNSKLTDAMALEAFRLRREGWTYKDIALHCQVSTSLIFALLKGETFKYLPRPTPRQGQ
jgi:hypothetical protein